MSLKIKQQHKGHDKVYMCLQTFFRQFIQYHFTQALWLKQPRSSSEGPVQPKENARTVLGLRESQLFSPQMVSGTLTCCVNLFMKAAIVQHTLLPNTFAQFTPSHSGLSSSFWSCCQTETTRQPSQRNEIEGTTPDRHPGYSALAESPGQETSSQVISKSLVILEFIRKFYRSILDDEYLQFSLVISIYPALSGRREVTQKKPRN